MSLYKPEDFDGLIVRTEDFCKAVAEQANRILRERGVRVTGKTTMTGFSMHVEPDISDTHQGFLICIEELPKAACEHEPDVGYGGEVHPHCYKCGIKLKWEPA